MTPIVKILSGIVVVAALGTGAWFIHNSAPSSQHGMATSTTAGSEMSSTTTITSTTTSTTTVPPGPTPEPTPRPAPTHGLSITSIAPSSGPSGTFVTLRGNGFDATSQVVIGNGGISDVSVNAAGTLLTFTMPSSLGAYCLPRQACPMYALLLKPGTYSLNIRNSDGITSNAVSFTLTSSDTP
ncbi:hypothetical protein BH11PAT2_BH11PAT2_02620 [soil metagenome]